MFALRIRLNGPIAGVTAFADVSINRIARTVVTRRGSIFIGIKILKTGSADAVSQIVGDRLPGG
jgi:hypothetical protein